MCSQYSKTSSRISISLKLTNSNPTTRPTNIAHAAAQSVQGKLIQTGKVCLIIRKIQVSLRTLQFFMFSKILPPQKNTREKGMQSHPLVS